MKELERSLGPLSVVAISMSAMPGIFLLPGLAAAQTGPSVWLAYLLAGLAMFPAATCKAELATAMPTSGGAYVYLDRLFGPLAGTVSGVALWLSMLLKSAFALIGFGTYLVVLTDLPLLPTASVLLLAIVALNIVGAQSAGRAQVIVTVAAFVVLVGLTGWASRDVARVNLEQELSYGVSGLLAATGFVFVSYNGITKAAAVAEEVKDPERNLPLGILASLGVLMAFYAAVTLVLVGVVPHTELATDLRPLHTLADRVGGPWAGRILAVIGVAAMTAMANAGLLAASRFPFAMARDQLLPPDLATVNARFLTPVTAIVLTGAAMLAAIWLLDVEKLAKLASGLILMVYVAVTIAVIAFRESRVAWYQPKYRSPLYPWLQVAGIIAGLVLLFVLGATALLGAALVALPGVVVYFLYGRRRTVRLGLVAQRSKRAELLHGERSDPVAATRTEVVVALLGKERSPEMIVEVGAALASADRLQVLHLTEVPEQTPLEAAKEEDATVRSIRRRTEALAEERGVEVDFRAMLSRDLGKTLIEVASAASCEWVVMEWRGREREALLPYNPIGWLINHLDANLASYKDSGVRFVREILVWAEPGPHDALVVDTADHLAHVWNAKLTLIRFAPTDAPVAEFQAVHDYLSELKSMCTSPAGTLVVRGRDRVSAISAATAAYDLLVMGAPDVTLRRMIRGSTSDLIKARSACSVLTVRTPRRRTHEAYRRTRATIPPESGKQFADFLAPGAVGAKLPIIKKEALFQAFAERFSPGLGGLAKQKILDALWDRERTQNTSVGHGVALPHATLSEAGEAFVGVFTTAAPVDYEGPDDEPVDVFFVTICPPSARQTHLELLSRIAALTLKTTLLDRLRSATTNDEMLDALHAASAELQDGEH